MARRSYVGLLLVLIVSINMLSSGTMADDKGIYNDTQKCNDGGEESVTRSPNFQARIDMAGPGKLDEIYLRYVQDAQGFIDQHKHKCKSEKCYLSKKSFQIICGENPDAELVKNAQKGWDDKWNPKPKSVENRKSCINGHAVPQKLGGELKIRIKFYEKSVEAYHQRALQDEDIKSRLEDYSKYCKSGICTLHKKSLEYVCNGVTSAWSNHQDFALIGIGVLLASFVFN